MKIATTRHNFKNILHIFKIHGILLKVPKLRNVIIWSANSKMHLCEIASSIISPRERYNNSPPGLKWRFFICFKTKHSYVKTVVMISPLLQANRNFSPLRGLPMNRAGVRNAERQRRSRTPVEETLDGVSKEGPNAKCIRRYAILAELKLRFLFNPPAINPFIAAIALNRAGNSIKKKKFSAKHGREFFLFHRN
jgi:hypothetical protein